MDRLRIPLAAITETGVSIDVRLPCDSLHPEKAADVPVESVSVEGILRQIDHEYLFQGAISGVFVTACDRCLEGMTEPFSVDVLWNFQPGAASRTPASAEPGLETAEAEFGDADLDDEQLNTFPFSGNEIDLAPPVWEELVLAAPAKHLCRPECAGLCPHCGANLNNETCACPKEETMANKGLAVLAVLLPQLKPKPPKE